MLFYESLNLNTISMNSWIRRSGFNIIVTNLYQLFQDGGNLLVAVDEGQEHTMSVWDWQRGERGSKITETKCATETVVAAEFHPLEAGVIVTIGKGHVNFWTLDNTRLDLAFQV